MKKRSFVDEIRAELDEQELNQYYELMRDIKENHISEAEAFASLDELFKDHSFLIVGLNNFLNSYCAIHLSEDDDDDDDSGDVYGDSDNREEVLSEETIKRFAETIEFVKRIKNRFRHEKETFCSFLNTMLDQQNINLEPSEVYTQVAKILEQHPDLMVEFEGHFLEKRAQHGGRVVLEEEIPEIRITPSYVLLPGKSIESMDIDQEHDVLNNVCMSAPPGIDDFSNRATYGDESENIIEDQRFQIDMLSEYLKSTASIVQKYLEVANSDGPKMPIEEKDYLKPRNLRCIEYLYGDYGLDVIDILRWNPKVVLPVLMNRLNQKQEELRKFSSYLFNTDHGARSFMAGYESQEVDDVDRNLQVAERYEH